MCAGAPYELLLPRSVDFTILGDLMGANYPDPQARIGLLAVRVRVKVVKEQPPS